MRWWVVGGVFVGFSMVSEGLWRVLGYAVPFSVYLPTLEGVKMHRDTY